MDLLQKLGLLKTYASGMKDELERRHTKEGKLMPKDFQEAPVSLDPEGHKTLLADVRKSMARKEDMLAAGRIEQLEAENAMLKGQLKQHGLIDNSEMVDLAEEKARLLQEQVDQQKDQINMLEGSKDK